MGKIVKLTESELVHIIKKTIMEQQSQDWKKCIDNSLKKLATPRIEVKLYKEGLLNTTKIPYVSYSIKYNEFLGMTNPQDVYVRNPNTGKLEIKPGEQRRKIKEKILYWRFLSDGTWKEGNGNRSGKYTCNNGELTLYDEVNAQKYSTTRGKKWIGDKDSFENIKQPTPEKPSTPATPENPSTSKIPQGRPEKGNLIKGMRGNKTMALQNKLGVVGYGNKPTGYFGQLTQAAVTKAMSKLGKQYDPNVGLSQTDYNQIMGNQQQPVDNEPWLGQFKTQ